MARILIIDDEEFIRMTVVQALEDEGHTVVEAGDGEQGLAEFRRCAADVVITDILMPNVEGIQTIRELRQINADVKIIAISGGGRIDTASILDMAQKLGADAVLKKPFEVADICLAVRERLEPKA